VRETGDKRKGKYDEENGKKTSKEGGGSLTEARDSKVKKGIEGEDQRI